MTNSFRYLIFALVLVYAGPAFAQDPAPTAPDAEAAPSTPAEPAADAPAVDPAVAAAIADAPVEEAAAEDPAAEDAAEEAPAEEEKLDPNDPLYWAKLRGIYTLQKRAFQKEGRFSMTIYGGLIPNNIFERYFPIGLRVNYYILENLGVEFAGSYNFASDTGLSDQLQEDSGVGAEQVLVGDSQVSHSNFGIVWSPFFGKTSFYNSALNYFDIYLFAGVGLVVTETTPDFNADPETEAKPEGAIGAGMAFYFGEHMTVRADFRQFVFEQVTGGVANPSEVSLGLGWFF